MALSVADALLIGVMQGLLEWLPVSSSGQITLFYSSVLGLGALEGYRLGIAAHLGTALSAAAAMWREVIDALRGGMWLRVALVPTVAAAPVGLALYGLVGTVPGAILEVLVGLGLIATGLVLRLAGAERGVRRAESLSLWELVVVGIAEGAAIVPGLSRSASTIAVLSLMRLEPREAVKASFFMAIPATLLAASYELYRSGITAAGSLQATLVLLISSFAAGIASIGLMLGIAGKVGGRLSLLLVVMGAMVLLAYAPLAAR